MLLTNIYFNMGFTITFLSNKKQLTSMVLVLTNENTKQISNRRVKRVASSITNTTVIRKAYPW